MPNQDTHTQTHTTIITEDAWSDTMLKLPYTCVVSNAIAVLSNTQSRSVGYHSASYYRDQAFDVTSSHEIKNCSWQRRHNNLYTEYYAFNFS
jgi:hypothetical protein